MHIYIYLELSRKHASRSVRKDEFWELPPSLIHVKLWYFIPLGGYVSNGKYSPWPPKPTLYWLIQYRQQLVLIFVCTGPVWPALKSIKVLLFSSLAAGLDFLFILLFLSVI